MKIVICDKARIVLMTALFMYTGGYPWAYRGADFWRKEATELFTKLSSLLFNHLCSWHPGIDCRNVAELVLSDAEKEALRCSLELYTGKYKDYQGAQQWRKTAERFLKKLQINDSETRLFEQDDLLSS